MALAVPTRPCLVSTEYGTHREPLLMEPSRPRRVLHAGQHEYFVLCWPGVIVRSVQVLHFDAGNVEATACLGSYQFYADQPEVAMIYFRRILQLGMLIASGVVDVLQAIFHHAMDEQTCLSWNVPFIVS